MVLKQGQNENVHGNWQRHADQLSAPEPPACSKHHVSTCRGKGSEWLKTTQSRQPERPVLRRTPRDTDHLLWMSGALSSTFSSLKESFPPSCPFFLSEISIVVRLGLFLPTTPTSASSWKNIQKGAAHSQLCTTNLPALRSFTQSCEHVRNAFSE